ncbi:protein FAR1-RELATED SEQUENCE 5-like [Lotus japonicus]|uniref:protein FAR1-RELATED SEQUENCE 5-like n=1 Tax=Lotus japonicus TaxID=34305 RepID=UPI00258D9BAA|nr:protein FAR1-RELATED SEQUENCE 5-like [Lotus japonicus]
MGNINFITLTFEDMKRYRFLNCNVTYDFYNMYARFNGFYARRSVMKKNFRGEIVQQNLVCHKQGHKEDRFGEDGIRKCEPRRDIRCGCLAHCKVHIDESGHRWVAKHLDDDHSHLVVRDKHVGLLSGHRKMCDMDVSQMNNMIGVGISPPQVYSSFTGEAGGYLNVNFNQRNMYNELAKKRRKQVPDASGAFGYLRTLRSTDPDMYWSHQQSEQGNLLNLFWCDGQSRTEYSVFGDVLAFDATYTSRKNKYSFPLVILSGVNHHNRTIVFGTTIVSDEKEETYVWLLEKFADAMKGKTHVSVITDGCKSMRKEIRRVFPNAHHRLCAWNLFENATRNVKKPGFLELFKRCMLGDYEVVGFEDRWEKMVIECEVQDDNWVNETYEKKGNVGFCIHAWCMTYFRFKEVEDDFNSTHGDQVLVTSLKALERSASKIYTYNIFLRFRVILQRASTLRVYGFKRTTICERMESVGIPCDQIVSVMVHIEVVEIPKALVIDRWTINAKESIEVFGETEMKEWDKLTVG